MTHVYKTDFFNYISHGAQSSARVVANEIGALLGSRLHSVIDVGCGQGVWAAEFARLGTVSDVVGVDGDYVDPARLCIPRGDFYAHDLKQPLDLGRTFSLAVCLEVGEHLPHAVAPTLVGTLVRHAPMVLFSAAVPGQGGEHHINEQPLEFWRGLFAAHGYTAFDPVRPGIQYNGVVEPWYRYNTLLYLSGATRGEATAELRAFHIPDDRPVPERAPLYWRLRCGVIRQLPRPAVEALAATKHAVVRARRKQYP